MSNKDIDSRVEIMANPYSGIYSLVTSREKNRLYEIVERCNAMGMGYPIWFEDDYNGIIESMPPNVFMRFLDALEIEGNLHSEMSQYNASYDIKELQRQRKRTGDVYTPSTYPDAFIPSPPTYAGHIQSTIEDLTEAHRCYQDAARIKRNVIPRYKRWYAKDYGPYRPLRVLSDSDIVRARENVDIIDPRASTIDALVDLLEEHQHDPEMREFLQKEYRRRSD